MNKIKLLPQNISNKIAAGEVVQRPESVVKELLENSIDAEAKNIDLIIKDAGKTLIQVADDGAGMTEDDALLSVQRHATSKISSIDDLENIQTFGFRGEALSSIASVSKFELKTEVLDEELGTIIKLEDETNLTKEKGSFGKGTSIAVKNLFYNVPARRNFLKSNATELKHIVETFKKTALSHPEVTFRFYNGTELQLHYKEGSLESRIKSVFGKETFDSLIKVSEPTDFLSIEGFIAKPTFLRKNKGNQYLFINGRYVNSKMVNHAVFSAYENLIEKGDYPFFVLFLELDARKIDINIHPTKLEVKFDDEKSIYSLLNAVVKKSIGSYDLVPGMKIVDNEGIENKIKFDNSKGIDQFDFSDRPSFEQPRKKSSHKPAYSDEEIDSLFDSLRTDISGGSLQKDADIKHPFEKPSETEIYHKDTTSFGDSETKSDGSFIVALHNKYILSQIKSGLMIIDAHVAHERILYEKALEAFSANIPFSQQLLFSQELQVDPGDYELLKELNSYLSKLGFEIKFSKNNKIVINGVPSDIKMGSEMEILQDILEEYKSNQQEKGLDIKEKIAASYSCKAAIKAGDRLTEKEMRLLVDQLFATSMPYVCPHGRPIVIKISLNEFDNRFGRNK